MKKFHVVGFTIHSEVYAHEDCAGSNEPCGEKDTNHFRLPVVVGVQPGDMVDESGNILARASFRMLSSPTRCWWSEDQKLYAHGLFPLREGLRVLAQLSYHPAGQKLVQVANGASRLNLAIAQAENLALSEDSDVSGFERTGRDWTAGWGRSFIVARQLNETTLSISIGEREATEGDDRQPGEATKQRLGKLEIIRAYEQAQTPAKS